MMQPVGHGWIARALVGALLGLGSAPAWAQPSEPAAPAAKPAPAPAAPPAPAAATPATPDKAAAAKPGTAAAGSNMPPGTSVKVERTASGAKLFRITESMLVEGQMQRPNAFLVLQRATVDYDYEALSESFLPRIIAAAREKPF